MFIVVVALFAVAFAAPAEQDASASVLRYENENTGSAYKYA